MFRKNTKHLQPSLFGFYYMLPKRMQKEIKETEEYAFYKIIFSTIDEDIFAGLYSEKKSRPNAPINALVSALILMHKKGWSYEALFKEIKFNILTKIALGLDSLESIPFSPATIFNFQNRLNSHFVKTGENLLEQVFDKLTEKQLKALKIKTDIQRTDSFGAASNIRNYSRLQLLIELIIRLWRVLDEDDKEAFKNQFEPYTGQSSGQYIYKLTKDDLPKELAKIGELYYWIKINLWEKYQEQEIFKTFDRVFTEHFKVVEKKIEIKSNEELKSDTIQSPDDLDASYRKKNGQVLKGQSVNIVETANPENKINLLTDVSVNPANKDDSKVLNERIDKLKEKTPELQELHYDGAYGSNQNDEKLRAHQITGIQTGVRGRNRKVPIRIYKDGDNKCHVKCPYQEVIAVQYGARYKAEFNKSICAQCPLNKVCSIKENKKFRVFYFTEKDYLTNKRQRAINNIPEDRKHLRNNVEASVKEFTSKMPNKKLKVRGLFKTGVFSYTTAIGINFGRIFRYMKENNGGYFIIYFLRLVHFILKSVIHKTLALDFRIVGKNESIFGNIRSISAVIFAGFVLPQMELDFC